MQFSEDISVQLSKNTIEPSFISSKILNHLISNTDDDFSIITEPSHLKY